MYNIIHFKQSYLHCVGIFHHLPVELLKLVLNLLHLKFDFCIR